MGKAGRQVPYKMPPAYLAQQARQRHIHTDVTYPPGTTIRYKRPPPGSEPKRRGPAPTPPETPREAMASELPTLTAPYIPPPPQSPQRARSPRHDVRATPAQPIRNTTRPSKATENNANATRAAAERDGENVTNAMESDRENDQTAHASRPTETTQVGNRQPRCPDWLRCFGWLICLGWLRCLRCPRFLEASVGPDAPVPLQKQHST